MEPRFVSPTASIAGSGPCGQTLLTPSVTTVAGSGEDLYRDGFGITAALQDPRGLTLLNGRIYFLDAQAATLRRFDPLKGEVVTLAGSPGQFGGDDGTGAAARFVSPRHMTSDGSGRLFIVDTKGAKIRVYDVASGEVNTLAGDGTPGCADGPGASAKVHRPRGIAFDGASIYWGEFNRHTIRQLGLAGDTVSTLAGRHCAGVSVPPCPGGFADGVGTQAQFSGPLDLVWHATSGSFFVFDSGNAVLRRVR